MIKKKAKKKSKAESDLEKYRKTSEALITFVDLLENADYSRRLSSKETKKLIKGVLDNWAAAAKDDPKQKHQASLIKGYAEFLS